MILSGFLITRVVLVLAVIGSVSIVAMEQPSYNTQDPNLIDISSESKLEALPHSWELTIQDVNSNSRQILEALKLKGDQVVKSKEQTIEVELTDKKSNL